MSNGNAPQSDSNPGGDRRRAERFDTRLQLSLHSLEGNTTMEAWALEISSTGMRLETPRALVEGANLRISFVAASNNTFCETRVVWCRPSKSGTTFDIGINIVRWGGDLPTDEFIRRAPNLRIKPDRRRPR